MISLDKKKSYSKWDQKREKKRYEWSFAIMRKCKIRKWKFEEEVDEYYDEARAKFRFNLHCRNEKEVDVLFHVSLSTGAVILVGWSCVGPRQPNRNREVGKVRWDNAHNNWDNEQFKDRVHISKQTFSFILNAINQFIVKPPANIAPNPSKPERQLGLTNYRLARECLIPLVSDLFGISKSLAIKAFNHVVRELMLRFYSDYIKVPKNENEWINEIKGFIENMDSLALVLFWCIHQL